jgi:hypothetical protein
MSPISLSERQFLAIANAACLIGPLSATRSATGGCRSLGNSAGGLTKSLKTPKGHLPPYRKKPHRRTRQKKIASKPNREERQCECHHDPFVGPCRVCRCLQGSLSHARFVFC